MDSGQNTPEIPFYHHTSQLMSGSDKIQLPTGGTLILSTPLGVDKVVDRRRTKVPHDVENFPKYEHVSGEHDRTYE